MKTEAKPLVAIVGLATLGALGFSLYQLLPIVMPASKPAAMDPALKSTGLEAKPLAEAPAVTSDPFRTLETPVVVAAPTITNTPSTATAQSSVAPAPIQGTVRPEIPQVVADEPEITPIPEATGPKILLRGVIDSKQRQAYMSVIGKAAKAFGLGAELLPGVVLITIETSFVEVSADGQILRLRVGQEVQL